MCVYVCVCVQLVPFPLDLVPSDTSTYIPYACMCVCSWCLSPLTLNRACTHRLTIQDKCMCVSAAGALPLRPGTEGAEAVPQC